MEFRTEYNHPNTKAVDLSNSKKEVLEWTIDEKGNNILEKVDEIDMNEVINAHKNDTDVNKIIERYMKTGDIALLNAKKIIYGDFTKVPRSELEFAKMINKADQKFNSLDNETKALFDNNVNKFKAEIFNGTIQNTLNKRFGNKEEKKEIRANEQERNSQSE